MSLIKRSTKFSITIPSLPAKKPITFLINVLSPSLKVSQSLPTGTFTHTILIRSETRIVIHQQKNRDAVSLEPGSAAPLQGAAQVPTPATPVFIESPADLASIKKGDYVWLDLSADTNWRGDRYAVKVVVERPQGR